MDTAIKEKTSNFEVGDKCIFCQTPILDYGFARNPAPIGDLNRGRCCIHCDKNLVLPIRLGIIKGLELSYLIKKLYSLGLPKYKSE